MAAGVDAAHRAGVLHRDLKPENMLLPDSGIGPKVLDFGVAKMTDTVPPEQRRTLTQGATIIGTPAYMAPEQLRGESGGRPRRRLQPGGDDYEALTGRLPFGAGSFIDIGIKQAGGAHGRLTERRTGGARARAAAGAVARSGRATGDARPRLQLL